MKSRECAKNLAEPAKTMALLRPEHGGKAIGKNREQAKKGIDKGGRIWYSNKAVGAVMSCAGEK